MPAARHWNTSSPHASSAVAKLPVRGVSPFGKNRAVRANATAASSAAFTPHGTTARASSTSPSGVTPISTTVAGNGSAEAQLGTSKAAANGRSARPPRTTACDVAGSSGGAGGSPSSASGASFRDGACGAGRGGTRPALRATASTTSHVGGSVNSASS